ncbi:putative RING-H2 finger protein ATL49 [Oryza brachyantha]|uniref:putative RING-H2 finger protein ATL49 n=1 Tax=Oryza brachyantha TaxID=4533 RepID=UPI000776849E|nr:putative RING-H2 finger protein ATL49 [Oryza brachyantha]
MPCQDPSPTPSSSQQGLYRLSRKIRALDRRAYKGGVFVLVWICSCLVLCAGALRMSNSTWQPPPEQPPSSPSAIDGVENKISPSIVFIVAILAIIFFVCGLLHLLVRHLLRLHRQRRAREDAESVTAFQGQLQQLFHLHDAGVDQAFIDALPVFLYRNVVGGGGGADGKDPFDCAVCLCEFAPDDQLRLLPKCSHAFHLECIDTWLLSHSTCPLCRRSLLAELSPTCSPVVMVLESESTRDMVPSANRARDGDAVADQADVGVEDAPGHEGAEEVVEVKLGKFMCVEGNVNAVVAGEGDGAGTSSNDNGDANAKAGLGQRRCHSMGSYEYVMDAHASLRVAIKPPKKKPAVSKSRRRGAISECEFGASKRGESSLRLPPFRTPTAQKRHDPDGAVAGAKLAKDSFSVSKIWMVPSKSEASGAAATERRAVSFRWPVAAKEEEGNKKSGSEADWDVEAGSCGGNSVVSSVAEERPSFARRTLLWVVGGRQLSRVGSCS